MDYEKEVVPERTLERFEEKIRPSPGCPYGLYVSGTIITQNNKSELLCFVKRDERSHDSVSISSWEDLCWLRDKLSELLDKEQPCPER